MVRWDPCWITTGRRSFGCFWSSSIIWNKVSYQFNSEFCFRFNQILFHTYKIISTYSWERYGLSSFLINLQLCSKLIKRLPELLCSDEVFSIYFLKNSEKDFYIVSSFWINTNWDISLSYQTGENKSNPDLTNSLWTKKNPIFYPQEKKAI